MQLITTTEAAKKVGVSRERIIQLAGKLVPPPQRVNGGFVFTAQHIRAMKARNTKAGRPRKRKALTSEVKG